MANHGRQIYEHFKMSLQDKIEDIEEGGMDRKEADDVNQVLFLIPCFFKPIFFLSFKVSSSGSVNLNISECFGNRLEHSVKSAHRQRESKYQYLAIKYY